MSALRLRAIAMNAVAGRSRDRVERPDNLMEVSLIEPGPGLITATAKA